MTNLDTPTRRLGRSGLEVSALGLGCWAIGGPMAAGDQQLGYAGVSDDDALTAIRTGLEAGVSLFDTSDAYGTGHSERLLGQALAAHTDILLATKFGNVIDEDSRQLTGVDVSPAYIAQAVEASLSRLRRSQIDLYQVHTPAEAAERADDVIDALEGLVEAGKIRWWGVSTDDSEIARRFATGPHCTAMQVQLNVFDDNEPMLAVCRELDLGVLCRSPLAMGLLGGRYSADTVLADDDVRGKQPQWLRWFAGGRPSADFLTRLDLVRGELTAGGRTLAQGALGWIWARDDRAVPLPGFRNSMQVAENTGALAHGALPAASFARVEELLRDGEPR